MPLKNHGYISSAKLAKVGSFLLGILHEEAGLKAEQVAPVCLHM
jgi:hypothetical protein